MKPDTSHHITYLLRLWPVAEDEESSWRALLENPRTGERQVFRDLGALCAFLEALTHRALPGDEETCAPERVSKR